MTHDPDKDLRNDEELNIMDGGEYYGNSIGPDKPGYIYHGSETFMPIPPKPIGPLNRTIKPGYYSRYRIIENKFGTYEPQKRILFLWCDMLGGPFYKRDSAIDFIKKDIAGHKSNKIYYLTENDLL